MKTIKTYDSFPVMTVLLSNLVSLAIYCLGFLIIYSLGLIFSILYLVYVFILEIRLIRNHCTNCYYWGKICGFGKGRISSWFFKKGDTSKFCEHEFTWRDMIPDLLVSLVPLIIGIILLIIEFDLIMLFALLLIILLTTTGNGFVRGSLTCKYCKQKELGCLADSLFTGNK